MKLTRMNPNQHPSEGNQDDLDKYIDALLQGTRERSTETGVIANSSPRTQPSVEPVAPVSPIPADTTHTVQGLLALAEATPVRAAFTHELEARLHNEAMALNAANASSTHERGSILLKLLSGLRQGTHGTQNVKVARPIHNLRLGVGAMRLVVVGIVLLLALAAVAWFTGPQQVSASQILTRAEKAAINASVFGLQSYHGLVAGHNTGFEGSGVAVDWQQEVWFQSPDKRRIDFQGTTAGVVAPSGAGANASTPQASGQGGQSSSIAGAGTADNKDGSQHVRLLIVENGPNGWLYEPSVKRATTFDPTKMVGDIGPGPSFGASDLEALLRNAGVNYDVKLIGKENVAGRATYVLAMTPKPGTIQAKWMASALAWIDQQTYLQLRSEWKNAQGNIITEWAYTSLDENPAVDAALFTFTPPPGAEVVWQREPTGSERADRWQQIAQQTQNAKGTQGEAFHIYMPTYTPGGLTTEGPRYQPDQAGGVVEQNYRSQDDMFALNLKELAVSASAVSPGPSAQPVQIGSFNGRYSSGASGRTLILEKDGTQIVLQAKSEISKDDLFQLAASLQPVPVK